MDRKSTMISEKASVNSTGKKEKSVWENTKRQTNFFSDCNTFADLLKDNIWGKVFINWIILHVIWLLCAPVICFSEVWLAACTAWHHHNRRASLQSGHTGSSPVRLKNISMQKFFKQSSLLKCLQMLSQCKILSS